MRYIFTVLCFTSILHGYAQISISGKVQSEADESTFPGATVMLLNPTDSSLVAGTATDFDGAFKINNIKKGNYLFKAQFVGFQEKIFQIQLDQTVDMGVVALKESTTVLEAVEVTAERPMSIQKGDTTQYSASSFKTTRDASSQDLIVKMPGISVQDGQIQAHGEAVQQVLVDGKPFFGGDVKAALQNLPAEMIESIQVYEKKSDKAELSGFDDGDNMKTINIITKPDRKRGQFGRVTAGYGTDDSYLAGASINFFNNDRRITVTGLSNNINAQNFSADGASDVNANAGLIKTNSIGMNISDTWREGLEVSGSYFYVNKDRSLNSSRFRDYILPSDSGQTYSEQSRNSSLDQSHWLNARLEYKIDKNNKLILKPNASIKEYTGNGQFEGITNTDNGPLNATNNTSNRNEFDNDYHMEAFYSHKFHKKGRSITTRTNVGYHANHEKGTKLAENNFYKTDSVQFLNQGTERERTGLSWQGQVSYTEPLSENSMMEIEYSVNSRMDDSDKRTYDQISDSGVESSELDTALSNIFQSNYLMQRAEVGYQFKKDKIGIQTELEFQHAALQNDQVFPVAYDLQRTYRSALPTVRFDYNITESKKLEMDYWTWTNAPSVGQLQDVIDNNNPLQLRTGNPDLDQSYSHRVRTRYRVRNPDTDQTVFAQVESTFTQDYVTNSTTIAEESTRINKDVVLEEGSQLTKPVNVQGYWNIRSYFSYGQPIEKLKSNFYMGGWIRYTRTPGLVNDETNFSNSSSFGMRLGLSSNISENIDFNLSTRSNYSVVQNSLRPALNNNFYTQSTSVRGTVILWDGLVYRTDLNHQMRSGLSKDFNNSYTLLNMSVGKKFLKDNLAEVSINVYDLLGQNNNVRRNVSELYIEDSESTVLQRYFMLTLTYNLRHFSRGTTIDDFKRG